MTTSEKLARIQHYATRYEVIAENTTNGEKMLIGYTSRKSKAGIVGMTQQNGPAVVKALNVADDARIVVEGKTMKIGNEWILKFSGRTQREAIIGGELAFVVTIAESK